jgi:hypothetical protein
MNISSHQGEVVLNEDGELQHPISVDTVSVILKFFCCSIGIPLNLFIAVTIIQRRRLHRKSRNIFLLGITLSYLSFFIPPAIELIYWALYPVESVCHAYIIVVAVPQSLLLINMLLALTERYLAINHQLLHRRKMTTRLAGPQSTAVPPMCIHADRDKLNEMEASRTLVIGVASLCVMPCLALIFMASYFACRLVCGQLECSYFVRIMPLIKELSSSPAVYGPIIFIVRNKELREECACKTV